MAVQTPETMANNVVQSSLYTDGWWPWYGTALLTHTGAGESSGRPYGRFEGTSSRDYLDRITASHAKLDKLLALPKNTWPARQDGKLNWLKARVAHAKNDKVLTEAQVDLENYMKLVRMGGY